MRVAIGLVASVGIFYMLGEMNGDNNLIEFSKELMSALFHRVRTGFHNSENRQGKANS